jgi:protein-S-isoprenylcysteine O-methyltransferase Ste14
MPNNPLVMIVLSAIGILIILLALFNKPLLRWMKIKPMSEVFSNPKFQRSAKITEKLGQLFLVLFGISFLVQGMGARFLSGELAYTISVIVLGASGMIIFTMFIVVLANWKTK